MKSRNTAESSALAAMATPLDASRETVCRVHEGLAEAEKQAWLCLSKYKFWMFGYYAARWVTLKALLGGHRKSPFAELVNMARAVVEKRGYAAKPQETPEP